MKRKNSNALLLDNKTQHLYLNFKNFLISYLKGKKFLVAVFSEIWIKSIDIIGGTSMGCFIAKGKVKIVKPMISKWKMIDNDKLLYI